MFQLSPPRDAKVDQRWLNTGGNMDVLGTMDAAVQVCERRKTAPLPTLLTARHPQDTAHSTHMRALIVPPTAMFASPVRREPCRRAAYDGKPRPASAPRWGGFASIVSTPVPRGPAAA
jgi:hypothetical protein